MCTLWLRHRRICPEQLPRGYCADLNFCLSKSSFSCCSVVASFCCISSAVPLVTPQASGLDIEGLYGLPEAIRRFCQNSFLALQNKNTYQDHNPPETHKRIPNTASELLLVSKSMAKNMCLLIRLRHFSPLKSLDLL